MSSLVYDLHSHTVCSDGIFTPEQLVKRAVEQRVNVLAITDHDTVDALSVAQATIDQYALPLRLISGVEISTIWQNYEIHIVGLGMQTTHPSLVKLLQEQYEHRMYRATLIAERLEKARIPNALEGAKRFAGEGVITRAHFARFLLEQGRATSIKQVFKHYLSRGKIGYVPAQWCSLQQAISTIQVAGGRAVLAHPAKYKLSGKWLKRLLIDFSECGGDAMEVAHCHQSSDERTLLAQYAIQFGLAASQGSDFHQPCPWIELGRKLSLPESTEAIWQRYPELFGSLESQCTEG